MSRRAEGRSERLLRGLLRVVGLVAILTGVFAILTGAAGMPGDVDADPSAESELRYFAAFWVAYGVVALLTAPRVATATAAVRGLALAMFVGGLGRAIAWIAVGRPHGLFVALMAIELTGPPLVVSWQSRVARRQAIKSPPAG